jgi:YegS/Rv2252/BmrU family lipid kinase
MYYYIINPAAGGGKINKIQEKLKERLKSLGIAGEFEKSTGPTDIPKLTRIAIDRGFKTIVAVGGDGTINEMINAVDNSMNVAIGIIPMGSTNELANLLGIHDWQSACTILAGRKVEKVDLGKVGDKFFVTSANLGLDNILFDLQKYQNRSVFNRGMFIASLSKEAKLFKPMKLELEFDDSYSVSTECYNLAVSNGTYIDYLPQQPKPQDGSLDVILINDLSFKEIILYGQGKLKFNNHNAGHVSIFHTQKVTIKSKERLKVTADGQPAAETPVTITISDKKLNVIVSRKRRF